MRDEARPALLRWPSRKLTDFVGDVWRFYQQALAVPGRLDDSWHPAYVSSTFLASIPPFDAVGWAVQASGPAGWAALFQPLQQLRKRSSWRLNETEHLAALSFSLSGACKALRWLGLSRSALAQPAARCDAPFGDVQDALDALRPAEMKGEAEAAEAVAHLAAVLGCPVPEVDWGAEREAAAAVLRFLPLTVASMTAELEWLADLQRPSGQQQRRHEGAVQLEEAARMVACPLSTLNGGIVNAALLFDRIDMYGRVADDWVAAAQRLASAEALLQLQHQLQLWGQREPVARCCCGPTVLAKVEHNCRSMARLCLAEAAECFRSRLAEEQAVPAGTQQAVLGLSVTLSKLAHAAGALPAGGLAICPLAVCLEAAAGWSSDGKARRWACVWKEGDEFAVRCGKVCVLVQYAD